jgi:hypothetical protein
MGSHIGQIYCIMIHEREPMAMTVFFEKRQTTQLFGKI